LRFEQNAYRERPLMSHGETSLRNYDRINAPPPHRVAQKHAHIIGGRLAGLSAAAFLATDASMPAGQITIYETLPLMGGSMDAAGHANPHFSRNIGASGVGI
jgi:oleate hydratase